MGLSKEACKKAYETVVFYQTGEDRRKAESDLIEVCYPVIKMVSKGWHDVPEMSREDVEQELAIFLLEVAKKFPAQDRDDFIPYYVRAAKAKLKHFYSEKVGISVPHSTADENRARGIDLKPSQESYDAILQAAAEDGTGAAKLKDRRSPDPLSGFLSKEARQALNECIESLGEDDRFLIQLFIDGESPQEIADDLGEADYALYRHINKIFCIIKDNLTTRGISIEDFAG